MTVVGPQGSAAWLAARTGALTASNMNAVMEKLKSGKPSAARYALAKQLLAERLTGDVVSHFVTPAMQWGIEREPDAVTEYEVRTGELLQETGFHVHREIEYFGASPDRLLGVDTVVEVKCPSTHTHIGWMLEGAGEPPPEHQAQILAQMACTRRGRAVFISYDPRLPLRQQLYVVEWTPPLERIAEVEERAREFLREVDAMWDRLQEVGA